MHHYSNEERSSALAVLGDNGGNLTRTARETGVSQKTLKRWSRTPPGEQPERLKGAEEDTSWYPAFLEALMATGNVTRAAEAAGVGRVTVYDHRKRHPDLAAAWAEAREIGAEALEDEARRRAHDGWEEPVFYQGDLVATVRKYSDTLLIFLLKGAKPEVYRERYEHSGPGGSPFVVHVYGRVADDG